MPRGSRLNEWEDRRHWEEVSDVPRWVERRFDSMTFTDKQGQPAHYILTGKRYHYRINRVRRNGRTEPIVERSPKGRAGRLFDRLALDDLEDRPGFIARLFGKKA
jgi:hypothetical protein